MTARTASRTTGPRRTATRRPKRTARTAKTRTPKSGKLFSVPVNGKKTTYPSAWYFGR